MHETKHDSRHYKILPAWFVVWFVIGLGLFANDSHVQVYKYLQRFRRGRTPRRSALGEARNGLGIAPLRLLAGRVVRLLATPKTPGAFYKGMRLMALDGFVVDLPARPTTPASSVGPSRDEPREPSRRPASSACARSALMCCTSSSSSRSAEAKSPWPTTCCVLWRRTCC